MMRLCRQISRNPIRSIVRFSSVQSINSLTDQFHLVRFHLNNILDSILNFLSITNNFFWCLLKCLMQTFTQHTYKWSHILIENEL